MAKKQRRDDPTPQQIEKACRAIRAGWSKAELARRTVGKPEKLTAPVVAVREIAAAAR